MIPVLCGFFPVQRLKPSSTINRIPISFDALVWETSSNPPIYLVMRRLEKDQSGDVHLFLFSSREEKPGLMPFHQTLYHGVLPFRLLLLLNAITSGTAGVAHTSNPWASRYHIPHSSAEHWALETHVMLYTHSLISPLPTYPAQVVATILATLVIIADLMRPQTTKPILNFESRRIGWSCATLWGNGVLESSKWARYGRIAQHVLGIIACYNIRHFTA